MRKQVWASILVVLLQFAVAIYLYPSMPESMAVHWGASGSADGYGSRIMGLFFIPVVSAVLLPFFILLPRVDPSKGLHRFQEGYSWFVLGFTGYMTYIYGLSLTWNLGWAFDFGQMLTPVFGLGLYGLGVLMGNAKLNWFWGIRTPWTLSSESVWDSTHILGGKLFKVSGLIALAGALTGGWISILLILVPILASTLYLMYYSYVEFQKESSITLTS
jgi:uncharacterized membrane protein